MKKTEYLNFKSKFTLMNTNVCNENKKNRLKNENSSIVDRSYIYKENKKTNSNTNYGLNYIQSTKYININKELNIHQDKNEQALNNYTKNNSYSEMYVPEKYGLKENNTFVMTFCQPSLKDYFKRLFGKNSYEYDDYIQYKLYKKHYSKQEILINTIVVEKNAFHSQGLVKKLIVIKDSNHIPKKIIFV